MALAAPIINVQNGAAAPAVALAANAVAFVDAGAQLTFSLQSTTGVLTGQMNISGAGASDAGLNGLTGPQWSTPGPFSWTFVAPLHPCQFILSTEVTEGFNVSQVQNLIVVGNVAGKTAGSAHRARNVVGANGANVANLAAFTVAAAALNDNVSGGNVQGDLVLLVSQTSTAQNGLYMVGLVAAGTAPLTRVPDFATGAVLSAGQTCEIDAGTIFPNSTWKITTAGNITVDTTAHTWMPKMQTGSIGTGAAVTTAFVKAASTPIMFVNTAGAAVGVIGTITPGIPAVSTFTITGAGGTFTWMVTNW